MIRLYTKFEGLDKKNPLTLLSQKLLNRSKNRFCIMAYLCNSRNPKAKFPTVADPLFVACGRVRYCSSGGSCR